MDHRASCDPGASLLGDVRCGGLSRRPGDPPGEHGRRRRDVSGRRTAARVRDAAVPSARRCHDARRCVGRRRRAGGRRRRGPFGPWPRDGADGHRRSGYGCLRGRGAGPCRRRIRRNAERTNARRHRAGGGRHRARRPGRIRRGVGWPAARRRSPRGPNRPANRLRHRSLPRRAPAHAAERRTVAAGDRACRLDLAVLRRRGNLYGSHWRCPGPQP